MFDAHTAPRPHVGLILCVLASLLLTACGGTPPPTTYTIGVVNYVPALEPVLTGFKAQMAAAGYVEGHNITYRYHGVLAPDPQVLAREVQAFRAQQVALVLTLGTRPAVVAKQVLAGTGIPVVFAPVIDPVGEGLVDSLRHPGGNATGVHDGDTLPKALEWLHKLVPHATQIHVLYHPHDTVAVAAIKPLRAVAPALGVALILDAVHSPEAARAAIATLPKEAALFVVPTPSLEPLSALIEVAVQQGIAVGASHHSYLSAQAAGAVVTYAGDFPAMGQQAARLAAQILTGTPPAILPVETAEHFLHLNVRTATTIGLTIPDTFLRQADLVVR